MICQFYTEKDAFEAVARPILNKPKPKAEPPKEDKDKKEPEGGKEKKSKADDTAKEEPMETVNGSGNGEQANSMELD